MRPFLMYMGTCGLEAVCNGEDGSVLVTFGERAWEYNSFVIDKEQRALLSTEKMEDGEKLLQKYNASLDSVYKAAIEAPVSTSRNGVSFFSLPCNKPVVYMSYTDLRGKKRYRKGNEEGDILPSFSSYGEYPSLEGPDLIKTSLDDGETIIADFCPEDKSYRYNRNNRWATFLSSVYVKV